MRSEIHTELNQIKEMLGRIMTVQQSPNTDQPDDTSIYPPTSSSDIIPGDLALSNK